MDVAVVGSYGPFYLNDNTVGVHVLSRQLKSLDNLRTSP